MQLINQFEHLNPPTSELEPEPAGCHAKVQASGNWCQGSLDGPWWPHIFYFLASLPKGVQASAHSRVHHWPPESIKFITSSPQNLLQVPSIRSIPSGFLSCSFVTNQNSAHERVSAVQRCVSSRWTRCTLSMHDASAACCTWIAAKQTAGCVASSRHMGGALVTIFTTYVGATPRANKRESGNFDASFFFLNGLQDDRSAELRRRC